MTASAILVPQNLQRLVMGHRLYLFLHFLQKLLVFLLNIFGLIVSEHLRGSVCLLKRGKLRSKFGLDILNFIQAVFQAIAQPQPVKKHGLAQVRFIRQH